MRVISVVLATILTTTSDAFLPNQHYATTNKLTTKPTTKSVILNAVQPNKYENDSSADSTSSIVDVVAKTTALWAATGATSIANAAGPDWGIFEGRTGSLLHPITMAGLLGLSVSAGLLGFDWRRQRTIGDEISEIKKTLPDLKGSSTVKDAIAAAKQAEEVDTAYIQQLEAALSIESEITALQNERKELSAKGPRDAHFAQGSLLMLLGIAFAIEGPLNTYARAGKLFPGPHLYAGAGLVVLWALAASCVPYMQKGNDTARTIHIGANVAGIGMFAWQVTSGIPILLKVIEKTSWP